MVHIALSAILHSFVLIIIIIIIIIMYNYNDYNSRGSKNSLRTSSSDLPVTNEVPFLCTVLTQRLLSVW
jgi:hypothetical protein